MLLDLSLPAAMNVRDIFLPAYIKVLSGLGCPAVVHFAHFQVQARKRGVLGWGWECFVYVHIPVGGV